mmetsp:Transcript_8206/g.9413  ORF Transcript_8206/g.9413 Transcript_8206/m.9413 type:complete len:278 (+) Transcript_8206:198-1031(+)
MDFSLVSNSSLSSLFDYFKSAKLLKVEIEWLNISTDFSECTIWDDLFLLIPAYAVAVALLTRVYMVNGKPVASQSRLWKPVMVAYNVGMALFSFICFLGMAYFLLTNEVFTEDCLAAKRNSLVFDNIVYAFYISKYVEFADTLFLIVKGKQVSWLHWIHHMGAALDVGILYFSGFEGSWIFVILNGFVHTIMYTYYACSLMKIRLKGKSLVTMLQIIQFFTGFYVVFEYNNIKCVADDPNQMLAWIYNYVYVGLILLLFLNFYNKSYLSKSTKLKTK